MKKFAILASLTGVALAIGAAGASFHQREAEAKPNDVIAINPDVCAFLISERGLNIAPCYDLQNPEALADLANDLDGDVNDVDTYSDLTNAGAAQLGEDATDPTCTTDPAIAPCNTTPSIRFNSQSMWVLTFVSNDGLLTEDADEGVWLSTGGTPSSFQNTCPFEDEDCDATGIAGDGVVVDLLYSGSNSGDNTLDRGDAQAVNTQSGVDVTLDYTVVGAPNDLSASATKTTIQRYDGGYPCELSQAASLVGRPDVAGLAAEVTDDNLVDLTGIWVGWMTNHSQIVALAEDPYGYPFDHTVSVATGGGAAAAPNLACGGNVGLATVRMGVIAGPATTVTTENLDVDDVLYMTVNGTPATLSFDVNPSSISCNNSDTSTVTATFKDDQGNLVADGTPVEFSVQGPALIDPITTTTKDGSASTVVKGESAVTILLPITASSGAVQGSTGVECQGLELPPGDVNCSGDVSMVDAMLIAQSVVGLIDHFPCGG